MGVNHLWVHISIRQNAGKRKVQGTQHKCVKSSKVKQGIPANVDDKL